MSKRQKFIITSLVLMAGLFLVQVLDFSYRYWTIGGLSLLCIALTLWSLREALQGIRWLTTIILPALLTASIGLFYFLLPGSWFSLIPIAIGFGIAMYALLLTENIFSVAAVRTIQLFRAASAVGFLLTLLITFLLFDTIFSFRLPFWLNTIAVYIVSLPLLFHGFWSVNLDEKITRKLLSYSLLIPVALAQVAFTVSFLPLTVAMSSLFLTTFMYVLLGLGQAYFSERLFRQTVYEYVGVGFFVLIIMLSTGSWGGV